MAETVRSLRVQVMITGTVLGDDGALLPISETYDETFTEGSGSGQVGLVWQDKTRPLNTTSEEFQFDALSDFQGVTTSALNNIKMLYHRNLDEDTGDYYLLGGSAGGNEWLTMLTVAGSKVKVGPRGIALFVSPVDGFAVVAGDDLKIEAIDNSTSRMILAGDNA